MARKFIFIVLLICACFSILSLVLYQIYRSGKVQGIVVDKVIQRMNNGSTTSTAEQSNFIKHFLGFETPQTYLLLFLNNTELRPAGGFIGVYGIVKITNGVPDVVKVEGTEILDLLGPQDFPAPPPKPLREYLGIERWGFRDSNWNPDFALASQAGLDLYKKEQGVSANEIKGVIGITPTVMEELLKITGPFSYDGQEFTSENFTEKLEYEVEHAYKDKGVLKSDRKKILEGLTKQMLKKITQDVFTQWSDYLTLVERMLQEKHIMIYSLDPSYQAILETKGWSGTLAKKDVAQDYLLWTDANLGAWKTDHALKRTLSYTITPSDNGYIASVSMKYVHSGLKDWRTTHYLSYSRLFLPEGSKLITVVNPRKNIAVDQGVENGRAWFGTLVNVPIGGTVELTYKYYLSSEVVNSIKKGMYTLFIQKQNGTINHALTLDLDFGRRVIGATPGENSRNYGDNRFTYTHNLQLDQYFSIKLE